MKHGWLPLTVLVVLIGLAGGCDRDGLTGNHDRTDNDNVACREIVRAVTTDDPGHDSVLTANMALPNVAAAGAFLAAEGYAHRPSNAIVLIRERWEVKVYCSDDTTRRVARPTPEPVPDSCRRLLGVDTLVWQVFENPDYDSLYHTAVVTAYVDNPPLTEFIELKDSISLADTLVTVARHGPVINGTVYLENPPGPPAPQPWDWFDLLMCIRNGHKACEVFCIIFHPGPAYFSCVVNCSAGITMLCVWMAAQDALE